jgi:hypothetical protein
MLCFNDCSKIITVAVDFVTMVAPYFEREMLNLPTPILMVMNFYYLRVGLKQDPWCI